MSDGSRESDWKRFRKMVPELRERYLERLNGELAGMLAAKGKTPTDRFWDVSERMEKERKILVSCLDGHSRSRMFESMALMRRCGMLTDADLAGFSEALQSDLEQFAQISRRR